MFFFLNNPPMKEDIGFHAFFQTLWYLSTWFGDMNERNITGLKQRNGGIKAIIMMIFHGVCVRHKMSWSPSKCPFSQRFLTQPSPTAAYQLGHSSCDEVEGPQLVCYWGCYYHPLNDHIYFPMWIAGFVCLGPCPTHSLTS